MPFLNEQKRKKDCRNDLMINTDKKYVAKLGFELAILDLLPTEPVRPALETRKVLTSVFFANDSQVFTNL